MADKEATLLIKIKEMGSEALGKLSDGFKELGKVATAAFTLISGVVVASVKAYGEQEQATNSLNQSLIQQGIYTKELSDSYLGLANALQKKTLFADEDIVQSQAILQSYLGQTKITDELMLATLDLAQAKGGDLNAAAQMVGKSIGTETNALMRSGIVIDENSTKTEKLAQVVEGLNKKFGGQAQAAAQGYGALTIMQHTIGELFETMGEKLSPAIVTVVNKITELADRINNNDSIFDGFVSMFRTLVEVGAHIANIFNKIGITIAEFASSTANFSLNPKNWEASWARIKAISDAANEDRKKSDQETAKFIADLNDAETQRKIENQVKLDQALKAAADRKKQMQAEEDAINAELLATKSQQELIDQQVLLDLKEEQELAAELRRLENQSQNALSMEERHRASMKKQELITQARYDAEFKMAVKNHDLMAMLNSKRVQDFDKTMSDLSQLQNSKNKEMVAIGKAAAIAHITIDTARAAIGAYAALSPIPIVGPALGAAAAGLIVAYGAEKISRVNSTQMAEGGIVRSTPGGVNAVIGEGGKDEAVIPLDEGQNMLGNNITIVVNGGMLGDENSARELALALDRQLLKLRQSNNSLAFDSGVV